jgi:hypothetical protein
MGIGGRCFGGLWAVSLLGGTTWATAQESVNSGRPSRPSFWQAAAGVVTANGLPWAYNWYVQRWPWANVSGRTWGENLRIGFEWDDDCFLDNQFAHPYHGSLYLNSARGSGYGFWGSLPFVLAGSASWELFLENVRPSLNDLVNTTLGGMALGEVTYRLSSLLGSRRGADRTAVGRELGAFALSPIGRAQSFLLGKRPSEGDARPDDVAYVALGQRAQHPFVMLEYQYGSPFDQNATKPYDAFELTVQLSPGADGVIDHLGISGLLARRDLSRSERTQLAFGLYQHYDYRSLPRFEASGQSLSGALLYQRRIGSRSDLRLGTHVEALLLGAISSDHGHRFRRDYDYGPGAGARFSASLRSDGHDFLRFDARFLWLRSVYGASANHLATYLRVGGAVPLGGLVAIGGDIGVAVRHSTYRDLPSTTIRVPETRAFVTWPAP